METIVWNEEERSLLKTELIRIKETGEKMPQLKLMQTAQMVLPENRRKAKLWSGDTSIFLKKLFGTGSQSFQKKLRYDGDEETHMLNQWHHLSKQMGKNKTSLFIECEKILPPDRRRKSRVNASAAANGLAKKYKELVSKGHQFGPRRMNWEELQAKKINQNPPATNPNVTLPTLPGVAPENGAPAPALPVPNADTQPPPAPISESEPFVITIEKEIIVEKEPEWGRIPTGTLLRILGERIVGLEDREAALFNLTASIAQRRQVEFQLDQRLQALAPNAEAPSEKKLRICVYGTIGHQKTEIENATNSITRPLKLTFVDKDKANQHPPISADHCIIMRFVSHSTTQSVKSDVGSSRMHLVFGGVNAVIQKIFDLASRQTPIIPIGSPLIPKALTPAIK